MADIIVAASGIYAIRNKANNKMYVGSAVNIKQRWNDHLKTLRRGAHHSQKLQRAWIKYGADAFDFLVLEPVDDKADLIYKEQYWIDANDAVENGYNVAPKAGSTLGVKLSDESRAKLSAAKTGRKLSAEHAAAISAGNTGQKRTAEARAKMSAWQIGRKLSDEHRQKISELQAGRPRSEETKQKISLSTKGKKKSPEHVANMKGKSRPPEVRAKISAAAKERWKRRKEQNASAETNPAGASIDVGGG